MATMAFVGGIDLGRQRLQRVGARNDSLCKVRMGLPLELLAGDDQSGRKWLQYAPTPTKKEFRVGTVQTGRKKKKADRIRREEDRFCKYMTLRRQLTPWSEFFREEHGRTPSLRDVQEAGVPGLLEKFSEYVEIRDHFWSME
mmetsp:Transcript_24793/g.97994  ORF Transcript_24793/g.97994 Transcript_24793/m.97994 type:complete len:142 (+) Transcript_24793:234-659(+)